MRIIIRILVEVIALVIVLCNICHVYKYSFYESIVENILNLEKSCTSANINPIQKIAIIIKRNTEIYASPVPGFSHTIIASSTILVYRYAYAFVVTTPHTLYCYYNTNMRIAFYF